MALLDPPTTPRAVLPYQPGLDGLRALAVLAVIAYHLDLPWAPRGGAVGVTLFFSLSGYLITTLLLRELGGTGRVRLGAFYARRALRLFPALFLLVAAVAAYVRWVRPDADQDLGVLPYVLAYLGNWYRVVEGFGSLGALDHTWTLAVEEQFYLLWPPLLLLTVVLARGRWTGGRWTGGRWTGALLVVALVAAVAPLVVRLLVWDGLGSAARVLNGTDTAADPLMMGCALAVALFAADPARLERWRQVLRVAVWPAVALLVADGVLRLDQNDEPTGVTVTLLWGPLALGLASTIVVGFVVLRSPGWLGVRWLRGIGLISYGLYLWHYPVIRALEEEQPDGSLTGAGQLLAVALSLLIAGVSYVVVERPFLALKRYFPSGVARSEADVQRVTTR
jgi:peptidoglycan/LPS O-acetylase OafA/YrhL